MIAANNILYLKKYYNFELPAINSHKNHSALPWATFITDLLTKLNYIVSTTVPCSFIYVGYLEANFVSSILIFSFLSLLVLTIVSTYWSKYNHCTDAGILYLLFQEVNLTILGALLRWRLGYLAEVQLRSTSRGFVGVNMSASYTSGKCTPYIRAVHSVW